LQTAISNCRWLCLVAALVLSHAACPGVRDRPAERRALAGAASGWNILVLSVDTLRADRLGIFGYAARDNSPHLDRWIGSGVRFSAAHSARASTWPSLASALTGLYPSGHGVIRNGYSLPAELPTLPKILKNSGYRTAAFLSNMCQANHQGWDAFACSGGRDRRMVDSALAWAKESPGGAPFLLWTHFMGPHPPYYSGGNRATQLDPGYTGALAPKRGPLDRIMQQGIALLPADLQHLDAIYDAAVMGTDELIGQMLDGLAAAGKLEKTILVVLADHGEELYQHNRYLYHACSVYQTTLHVPFAIIAPGLLAGGAEVPQEVELIDLLPTILGLVGVPPPAEQHGVSLVPYLERPGSGGKGKPAFSEYDETRIRTIRSGDWKLIVNPEGIRPVCMEGVPEGFYPIAARELYNLATDPHEQVNLASRETGRVAELEQLLERRFTGLRNRAQRQELPEELRRELGALGYVAN
jgi:arylsulfatase A-like enzyme